MCTHVGAWSPWNGSGSADSNFPSQPACGGLTELWPQLSPTPTTRGSPKSTQGSVFWVSHESWWNILGCWLGTSSALGSLPYLSGLVRHFTRSEVITEPKRLCWAQVEKRTIRVWATISCPSKIFSWFYFQHHPASAHLCSRSCRKAADLQRQNVWGNLLPNTHTWDREKKSLLISCAHFHTPVSQLAWEHLFLNSCLLKLLA